MQICIFKGINTNKKGIRYPWSSNVINVSISINSTLGKSMLFKMSKVRCTHMFKLPFFNRVIVDFSAFPKFINCFFCLLGKIA